VVDYELLGDNLGNKVRKYQMENKDKTDPFMSLGNSLMGTDDEDDNISDSTPTSVIRQQQQEQAKKRVDMIAAGNVSPELVTKAIDQQSEEKEGKALDKNANVENNEKKKEAGRFKKVNEKNEDNNELHVDVSKIEKLLDKELF